MNRKGPDVQKIILQKHLHNCISPIIFILVLLNFPACNSINPMDIVKTTEGYQFYEGEKPVLFYRVEPMTTPEGTHSRANYCHPVMDLDGEVLTADFPEDHLHHRGIFWAWHQVYIGEQLIQNMWDCKDFIWDIYNVNIIETDQNSAALGVKLYWKSSQWKDGIDPFAEENVVIRVFKTVKDVRIFDFDIRINALVDGLRIGGSDDEKGYGGFSTRILLPDELQMTDRTGPVTPDNLAVPAGDWINFSGLFGSNKSGFAVMIHPSNPGESRDWILRKKSSCQNVAFPGREPVSIITGTPLVLKYRLVIHKEADLNKIFTEYSEN